MALLTGMTEKQLLAITVGVVAACVIVLGLGMAYEKLQHQGIVKETEETKEKLRELDRLSVEIADLEKKKEDMKAQMDEMKEILPAEGEAGEHELRGTITVFADEARLDWVSFKRVGGLLNPAAMRAQQKGLFVKEEFVIELTGGFHSLATFINKLEEDCQRLVWVHKINIEGEEGGLSLKQNQHDITVTLIAFKFRRVQQPGAVR